MKQLLVILLTLLVSVSTLVAQEYDLTPEEQEMLVQLQADSISGQTGAIQLSSAHCTLNVPEGFVFLGPYDSKHLLVDYWGNPDDRLNGVLGTMVKEDAGIFYNVETAYVISYDNSGYVSDKDAVSIDYDALLKDMQEGVKEENKNNPTGQKWELLGWGWQPTYDNQKKVLAWSKHYRIDGEQEVINYDVRVLGKAGFVVITAVAAPDAKSELMADNAAIINSVNYDTGYKYSDFNPDTDHVAEWTIGGLIAGKVLAKAGFWAVLAKFSKLIIIAIIGFFAAIRKKIARLFGFGKDDDENSNYLEVD